MQAPVTVGLGVLDVVLHLQKGDVILPQQAVHQNINIVYEGANHPHPCHIVEIFLHGGQGDGQLPPVELLQNAVHGFEAGFDGFDPVPVMLQGKLLVEDLELGLYLHHGTAVPGHQGANWRHILSEGLHKVPIQHL